MRHESVKQCARCGRKTVGWSDDGEYCHRCLGRDNVLIWLEEVDSFTGTAMVWEEQGMGVKENPSAGLLCPKCGTLTVHDMMEVFDRCLSCGWYRRREPKPNKNFHPVPSPRV